MAQNEIPDSFLFDKCFTFHLNDDNADNQLGYNDIWQKILEKEYLEILTDSRAEQKLLKNMDMFSSWGSTDLRTQSMAFLFEKQA